MCTPQSFSQLWAINFQRYFNYIHALTWIQQSSVLGKLRGKKIFSAFFLGTSHLFQGHIIMYTTDLCLSFYSPSCRIKFFLHVYRNLTDKKCTKLLRKTWITYNSAINHLFILHTYIEIPWMASNVEWWTCEFWETEAYIQAAHLLQEREPVKIKVLKVLLHCISMTVLILCSKRCKMVFKVNVVENSCTNHGNRDL